MCYNYPIGRVPVPHPTPFKEMSRKSRKNPAIIPHTYDLPIGTMVLAEDGYSPRLGQICDVETDRWGTHYVVVMADGTFNTVHSVMPAGSHGIGWKVATSEWVELLA